MKALSTALGFLLAVHAWGASVTWDGGGGDFSWQNALNWSGDALPGVADHVTIDVPSSITITSSANVTIASLQCSNHLTLSAGIFRVTSGESFLQGNFAVTGNPTLGASGTGTVFTASVRST